MSREAAAAVELKTPDDDIPSRQTYHKKKKHSKKKNKDRNPLFTSLAVMFVFIPIIVFVVFMYMLNQDKGGDSNSDQYDNVFYENKSGETGMTNENQNGEQEADQKAASQHTAAALQEEKLKENKQSENKEDEPSKKDEQKEKEQPKEAKKAKEKPVAAKKPTAPKQPAEQEKKTASAAQTPPVQQAPQPKKVLKHTVGEKETLYRISMKYYKNRSGEEKIRNYNQLSGNNVYTGQILNIPIY
ncbi:LysM peptidoglycan-binding domain-containing protein [Bacillus paralicheniformis]|uniref:LysM peptidoglycan-binding domain-containing protein n=1 Tax=Bacillus paralicheniformis TaxID=1648923 RepID=UPI0009A2A903|nr:LysM peptidoglycan-binding domain-containing protein [Bacillus paralicheniformis]KAA0843746.1 LysM peptidoglycan-binding domain-containing protein [Bacillus paralicheniformis]MBZ5214795.1 LysM peptidoglycan-binding domain-containing protein [Bacillus paralicheniformis]OPF74030.1 peptigoglycan-binding protein LysM [Bacillus paralicheniformis]PAC96790.1 peptigoglycan-binding protein LysM [Bacillus paralicheniformis]